MGKNDSRFILQRRTFSASAKLRSEPARRGHHAETGEHPQPLPGVGSGNTAPRSAGTAVQLVLVEREYLLKVQNVGDLVGIAAAGRVRLLDGQHVGRRWPQSLDRKQILVERWPPGWQHWRVLLNGRWRWGRSAGGCWPERRRGSCGFRGGRRISTGVAGAASGGGAASFGG
uniref:(northern house mosquito) hypothetical protein n=1 Tax=Culex pipiens TaxID=7175 RepID=A0A8D8FN05_CULPI